MAVFKGVQVDDSLVGLINHMHGVESYREALGRLQASWDTLTLLGQLSGGATEMSGTREAFETLSVQLLNHLGMETRKKVLADLRTKAQNGVDILVRNLFERTADIGFLAADTDVREFLAADAGSAEREPIEARFAEYVAKYSVYSDIVLFGTDGTVRARLTKHEAETSTHSLLHEALTTHGAYVEFFGAADFLPAGEHLVYAYRVATREGRALGVLALVFRLDDEMDGIFRNLIAANDWTLLACVTPDGRVIASSCNIQLPHGHRLPAELLAADGAIARLGGRQYVSVGCEASPYQGYAGPGWRGLGLIPTDMAFSDTGEGESGDGNRTLIETVMRNPSLFSDALRSIPQQAARIQSDLNRSVWNGSVRLSDGSGANVAFSKTLLREISNAGSRTQAVFDQSIGNLQRTVIAAISHKAASRASFAIDVMDRNLYERANDCRWWALDATFRRVLAEPTPDGLKRCGEVLSVINGLYTVYSNLMLFNTDGEIVAVSKEEYSHLVGTRIDESWVNRTLALSSSQHYAVSDFVPTPLYGGQSTYIYAATVRELNGYRPVGGVGIVFDATPQFSAMLTDSLPRDERGAVLPNSFALFVDRDGRVLASSDAKFPVGSPCGLALDLSALGRGVSQSQIVSFEGHLYTVGLALSSGYREYKVSDGYTADVISVCAAQIGREAVTTVRLATGAAAKATRGHQAASDSIEFATFYVGDHWFALRSQDVVEAIDAVGITKATGGAGGVLVGYSMHREGAIPVLDLAQCMGVTGTENSVRQIVVARAGHGLIGLLVNALGDIPEVPAELIVDADALRWDRRLPVTGVVRQRAGDDPQAPLLMILDLPRLAGFSESPQLVAAE